jgi:ABC-type uncharacterized transport system ATPase subunit
MIRVRFGTPVALGDRITAFARHRASTRPRERTMTALELQDLNKSFGGLRVTSTVNLAVAPGERRLIIGPNGAGKTTLFNLVTG